jgi:hypothetical protein
VYSYEVADDDPLSPDWEGKRKSLTPEDIGTELLRRQKILGTKWCHQL